MKLLSCFAAAFIFSSLAHAEPAPRQWTVQEKLSNGSIQIRVIQEIPGGNQSQLHQQVIFKKILSPQQAVTFKVPLISASLTAQPGKPLWVVSEPQWTQADEDDYSKWFETQVDANFLDGSGIEVDCADTGLIFRWVYARDHQLPIANSLSGSGGLFGHFSGSADWDKLAQDPEWKKDERFKAALRYLFDNSYTRTVVADLYPTEITPQYVRPGSMFMIIRKTSGHTQTIHDVDLTHGITAFWGNEPAAQEIFTSPLLIEVDSKQTIGMWRYVSQVQTANGLQWELFDPKAMPGYSDEQFQQTFGDTDAFSQWLFGKLGVHISDADHLLSLLKDFSQNLRFRQNITAMSVAFCYLTPCSPTSQEYADYSTPARDARLADEQKQILKLIAKLGADSTDVANALAYLPTGEIIPGAGLTYLQLLEDPAKMALLNPDPRVSYAERWGIAAAQVTPTIALNSYGVAIEGLLYQRMFMVYENVDSTSLDQGIRLVIPETIVASQAAGVDAGAFDAVRKSFQNQSVGIVGEDCGHTGGSCNFDDLTFTDDAKVRLPKWSSKASDSMAKRWGF